MSTTKFDEEAFFASLDSARQARQLTWKKVAEEARVSASTLTRLSQGKRPDVDSLAALCDWSGLNPDKFIRRELGVQATDPLAEITAHLRADPNLSKESVIALETLIKTAYERLRK